MNECKCTLAHRVVGDGCEVCNPTKAVELYKQTIDDLEAENSALKNLLSDGLDMGYWTWIPTEEIDLVLGDDK